MNSTQNTTSRYRLREIHTIDSGRALVQVTVENGSIDIGVDDRTGRGLLKYVEETPAPVGYSCSTVEVDDFAVIYWEGVDDALDVLHTMSPTHWGPSTICDLEPCASVRGELAFR